MADILKELTCRRSVRSYTDEVVSKDDILKIVEAGKFAASGMGRQPCIIVAVTDKSVRDKLSQMNASVMGKSDVDPFYGANVVLLVLVDKSCPTGIYDGSLVMGNMMNEAASLGLASCWIHRAKEMFESDEGKALLKKWGIQGEYEGIGNLIVGHAAGPIPEAKARKENFVYFV